MSRYLTSIDITEIDIKIHEELDSEKEMVMEGRLALRTFGTLAAAHLRERSTRRGSPKGAVGLAGAPGNGNTPEGPNGPPADLHGHATSEKKSWEPREGTQTQGP